jgi:hypothetical protein
MASTARGDQLQSPWVSRFADYQDKAITLTVTFNNTTRSITGGSITRDAGCMFTKILIGLGSDGRPDTTDKVFDVSTLEGTQSIGKAPFTARGFNTVEDIQALQITASP